VEKLHEFNPMLGHRGCRLGVTNPEIYDMQVRAILTAAALVKRESNQSVVPEIMIPLVGDVVEFDFFRPRIDDIAREVREQTGVAVEFSVGTMIELPRAALTADEIARSAEFFSFGTNDLTQTTYGLSRDDMSRFALQYHNLGIWPVDPFKTLDARGVGRLVRMGVELGRQSRPGLKVGICGEHGGDPASIRFCHQVGLDYVSCSPFRVPVARLAAAQAALD
jgi:pyruvate,orthophosphate dikinase